MAWDSNQTVENIQRKESDLKNSKDEETFIEYDQFLSAAGEFGLYQTFLFFLIGPFYIFGAFSYFSQIFLTQTSQDHWCWIPELANLTALERKALAIPTDNSSQFGYDQCKSYDANWTEIITTGDMNNHNWNKVPCKHGWEFNKSEIPYETISSEHGWVCDKDSYQATAQSIFFAGSIVGGFIVGWIADRFGRLPALVFSNCIGCVFGVISSFTKSFLAFSICRFFMGMSYDNCMMMPYLLVLEYIAPKYRTIVMNISFSIFFTLGVCVLPWIALACDNWKITSLATSIPLALSLLTPFLIPESPRWLLSKGHVNDAVNKVLNIAKINKAVVPPNLVERFKESAIKGKMTSDNASMIDFLKRPLLRRMFFCMCIEYFCAMIVYDALVRTIGELKFNFFVSFTLISFTEFPSLLLLSFVLDWLGRKWLSVIVMVWCAVFSFLTPFVGGGWPSVACAVIARFGVNMSMNASIQWSAEMFPTSVRGSASSVVHICSYVAMMISPFLPHLGIVAPWLPLVVVAGLSIFTALMCFALPETANNEIPQTFDDAEDLIRRQGVWDMPCFKKNKINASYVNDSFQMN